MSMARIAIEANRVRVVVVEGHRSDCPRYWNDDAACAHYEGGCEETPVIEVAQGQDAMGVVRWGAADTKEEWRYAAQRLARHFAIERQEVSA